VSYKRLQGQTKEGLYKVKQNRGLQGLTRAQRQGDFMENPKDINGLYNFLINFLKNVYG
jgi:hypothetical protein